MSELNTPRLMAAAKEFNIGKETLVDFLATKGFSRDDLKPSSKLTEDMYRSLQQEFSSDKAAKAKMDAIEIPKGTPIDAKKKKDEEEISFRKDAKKKALVAEVTETPAVPELLPVVELPSIPEPPELPEVQPAPVEPEVVEVKEEPAPEPVFEEPKVEENLRIEAPELEGPKVIAKIDLDAIDSSTRPKKSATKKPKFEPEAPVPVEEKVPVPAEEKVVEAPVDVPAVVVEKPAPPEPVYCKAFINDCVMPIPPPPAERVVNSVYPLVPVEIPPAPPPA